MKYNTAIAALCTIMCNFNFLSAQYTKQWTASYSAHTNSYEYTIDFARDTAEEFVYTWVLSDSISNASTILLKHRISNGQQMWVQKNNFPCFPSTMSLDNDQNIYICGTMPDSISISHFVVAKYSANGTFRWLKSFDDSLSFYFVTAQTIATDALGNVYIAGPFIANGITTSRSLIIKYDSLGNKVWAREHPDTLSVISLLKTDAQNNVYALSEDFALAKYNPQGLIQWIAKTTFNNTQEYPEANRMVIDKAGNYYPMGLLYDSTGIGYAVAKVNNNGTIAWVKKDFPHFHGFGEYTYDIHREESQNNLIITGITDPTDPNIWSDLVYKLDASTGQEVWKLNITHNSHTIKVDKQNNLLYLNIEDAGSMFILWLTQYDQNGVKTLMQKLDSGSNLVGLRSVILDRSDNILVIRNDGDQQLTRYTRSTNGINNLDNPVLKYIVYPNPFNTSLTFRMIGNSPENVSIRLFDSTGKEIVEKTGYGPITISNTDHLPAGMYFYTISNTNGLVQSGKVIAE